MNPATVPHANSYWLNLFSWLSPPKTTDHSLFAQSLAADILQFNQQLSTAFKTEDLNLQNRTISVDYSYQASLADLRARYTFTNQHHDWPANESPYEKIFLYLPLCKTIDYVELDEETHARIDRFIKTATCLLPRSQPPGNFGGFRFEDCEGSKNLRKINIVAVSYFEYKTGKDQAASIEDHIHKFEALVKTLSFDLSAIINKTASPEVFDASVLVPNDQKKPASRKNRFCTKQLAIGDNQPTNLQADMLMAKQKAFNTLFVPGKADYAQKWSFDMCDNGMQFNVSYLLNDTKYVAKMPLVFYTYFNVTKKFQEDQRKFCEENSSVVQPKGALHLIQNDVSYFQYLATSDWETTLTQEQMQSNLGTFSTNIRALNVI